MTLRDYLVSLKKHWVVVVALALLGAIAGYGYSQLQPEIFRSESTVIVIPARGDNTNELVQGSNYVANLVQTYAVVATSPTVLNPVIEDLGLNTSASSLAGTITVESPLNTVVLNIAVVSRDPALARDVADAVASELASAVQGLSPQNAEEQSAVRIETISPAKLSQFPVSPNVRLLTIAGAIAGLIAGVVFALLRRLLATRLTNAGDITALTDTPILGDVSQTPGSRPLPALIRADPTGSAAESLRSIVANLRFADVDGKSKVLLITSGTSGEGKSSIGVSIAQIMAEQGAKVLLVDADLRRASVATYTQLEGSVGLTTVLLGDVSIADAVQIWGNDGLHILTSGVLPPNPGQLLTSDHLVEFIETVRASYDYVIFDSAPVLAVSDPLLLAPVVDGIVLVARSRVTKRDMILRTITAFETTRVPILGIVLNGVKRVKNTSPYYRAEEKKRPFGLPPATSST
ncbi:polysaccharide biosynthesis tyrosine autokinase [Microbacterium sp. P01]|uniref:polysaccharide biosynthesis tyrosine autokinase n=1 Tax=unclassified Microbacterium TaxID=2609290 RepID=UPI00366BCE2F